MSVDVLIANNLRLAQEDLDGANTLAKKPGGPNRNAPYLYEQAAEKIIRAVATSEGVQAGRDHKLNELVDLIPDLNPIKPLLRAIEALAAFATAYRYLGGTGKIKPTPPATELATYAADVATALNEAAVRFGVDLAKPNAPAASPGLIR
jgi:HEPN domain-containing protein